MIDMPRRLPTNRDLAKILEEIGLMYQIEGVGFKPQAYAIAAKSVEEAPEELSALYKKCGTKCIDDLPGIGPGITDHLKELLVSGHFKHYEVMKRHHPYDLWGMTRVEGLGPKRAEKLFKKLGIKNLPALERAARSGKVAKIPGFGAKSQANLLQGIEFLRTSGGRRLLDEALPMARSIEARLRKIPGATHVDVCGSIRRRKETIGDLDFIATTTQPEKMMIAFKTLPEVQHVLESTRGLVNVRFKNGMDGDLLILKPNEYGAALLHFTGSKEHNIQIRQLALAKGWHLSEHGIAKGNKILASKTEAEIYKKLGMAWLPPELREGRGEVEVALSGKIPKLIEYGSLQGDLQVTTDWTDGAQSIEVMARAAQSAGLKYIAITDHTQSLAMVGGLNEKRLSEQGREIDRLNKNFKNFRILKSAEVNIRKDGSLDLSDAALAKLEVVSIAVHDNFKMPSAQMTARIIKAMKHPQVNILLHPTGRKLNERPPYAVDIEKIIQAAKDYHVALEVNASPNRLDLNDQHVKMAVEAGVKLVIDSDAHDASHFSYLEYGLATARRGWAKPSDVLNTKSVAEFLKAIKK
jgi:DNA polymerase (family 10)